MKKCWKQVLLFVMVAVAVICIGRTDAKAATIVEKGSCGDKATYTLDSKGTLTISGSGKITESIFVENEDIKKVVIQKNITEIGESTFLYCSSLKSITIPDSVTSIGSFAFEGCSSLKSITIPNGVTDIKRATFDGCTSLENITLPDHLNSIGLYALSGCRSLKSIIIPDSVTSIEDAAFADCSSLKSIIIPNGVVSIGNTEFAACTSLTSIMIPDSVTDIGDLAFNGCTSLENIVIPDSVTWIGYGVFDNCEALKKIKVATDNSVYDSRNNCNAIIETATNSLLYGCQSTTIPNNVTSIGDDAFYECKSLTSITIPDSLTSIGRSAFWGCSSLTSITIPNSVSEIKEGALGYRCDEYWNTIKVDSFTIYGTKGSAAETYAQKNGFTFKTTGGTTELTSKNTIVKLSKTSFNFDGKAKTPTVKVLDTKGRTLKKSYYNVTYSNNVKVGKATATITFKGKYSGTIKKTFTIKPAKTTITGTSRKSDSVTLTWKKQKKEASGYQIQYATDRKFTKNAKTVTSKGIKKSSKKISGLSKKTTYYFRVRTYKTVNGKKYYSGWSKIETVKTK